MTHDLAHTLCYRYHAYRVDYDEETVWAFVQRHGGYLSIRSDCIDFWIPRAYAVFFEIAYPELCRQPELDYL